MSENGTKKSILVQCDTERIQENVFHLVETSPQPEAN
jgi:hypothetical protein